MTRAAPAQSVEVRGLTKRYGATTVVDQLSFAVAAGSVTGFLGPNGSGKTTTLKMILGLAAPTAGSATILGRPYRDLNRPAHQVGVLLDANQFHPGRKGAVSLAILARPLGVPRQRVRAVLDLVGLSDAGGKRVGTYSLGMRQRLGLAAALLTDPQVLVLDEPVNGLDPQGIRALRDLMRSLAEQGRAILVSSHLLAEVQQTVDRVVVINRGRLVADTTLEELTRRGGSGQVLVRTPDADRLAEVLAGRGVQQHRDGPQQLAVTGLTIEQVGDLMAEHRLVVHGLREDAANLEQIYLSLTTGDASSAQAAALAGGGQA